MSSFVLFNGHIIFPANIAAVAPIHGNGCIWEWHITFTGGAVIPFNYKSQEEAKKGFAAFAIELSKWDSGAVVEYRGEAGSVVLVDKIPR